MVVIAASTAAVDPFVGRTGLITARMKPWQTRRRRLIWIRQGDVCRKVRRQNHFHNSGGEVRLDVVDSVVGSCGTELNACFDDAFCGLLFMVGSVTPVSHPLQELLKCIEDFDYTTTGGRATSTHTGTTWSWGRCVAYFCNPFGKTRPQPDSLMRALRRIVCNRHVPLSHRRCALPWPTRARKGRTPS